MVKCFKNNPLAFRSYILRNLRRLLFGIANSNTMIMGPYPSSGSAVQYGFAGPPCDGLFPNPSLHNVWQFRRFRNKSQSKKVLGSSLRSTVTFLALKICHTSPHLRHSWPNMLVLKTSVRARPRIESPQEFRSMTSSTLLNKFSTYIRFFKKKKLHNTKLLTLI